MILQLKAPTNQFPGGGGFPFKDPRTGFICNGYEGTPAMHAVKIIANRRANPHVYPAGESQWFDQQSVIQEIYAQKAATHPHLFRGYPDAQIVPLMERINRRTIAPTVACSCGSHDFEPVYCRTCAGNRIKNYKCKSCGKELKK